MATDLSPASSHVLECLPGLLPLGTRELILLHALGIKHLEEMKHLLAPQAEPFLAAQKATVEAQDSRPPRSSPRAWRCSR